MPHQNAPFTPEGRRRLIERIIEDGRPISHVADEAGISRQRLTVWLRRYEMFGDAGLEDRSSRPARSPNQTSEERRPGYTYLHAAVDDHSRLAYVECHDNERAVTAVEFFERARIFFASHGITVKSVLTDNGSCYISGLWKASCAEAKIKHRRTKRQTPRTNGKVERFNRTMKDEWLYVRAYTSEEDRRNHLVPFLNDYNHDRPHSAIGNRPPISRAPVPGSRLTHVVIELPPDHPGQLSLDLDP